MKSFQKFDDWHSVKNLITLAIILFLFIIPCNVNSAKEDSHTLTNSDSGLVAYYPFTGNAIDISGNNNHGSVANTTLTEDRFGNLNSAYLYNGTNSRISVSNSISIIFSNSIAISVWVKLSSIQSSGDRMILGKSNYINYTNYLIRIRPNGFIQWEYKGYYETTNPLMVNEWYHLYVDATGPNGSKRIFINGVQAPTNFRTSPGSFSTVSNPLSIGAAYYVAPSYSEFFHGIIDDIRIYNRVLSNSEIQALYEEDKEATLNLKVLFEGFYNESLNRMARKDTLKVYLRNAAPPYSIVDSAKGTIDSLNFSGLFNFQNVSSGTYYFVVKHFNCLETWSSDGGIQIQAGSTVNYDFTDSLSKAFGNNMIKLNNSQITFGIYSGDVNQDGAIDLNDVLLVNNDAIFFREGYINTDLTGDYAVDLRDLTMAFNNSNEFITTLHP